MRIAIVSWGGVKPGSHGERLLEEACRHFDVIAVTPSLAPSLADAVTWRQTPTWPARLPALSWLTRAAGANAALGRDRVDLVHELTPLPLVRNSVDLVTPFFSYTALYEALHGRPPEAFPPVAYLKRAILRRIERWAYSPRRVRLLAAQCEGQRAELERLFPTVPAAIVPRGTNTGRFRPALPGERERLRRELGIPRDEHVAILIARAEPYKGLSLALEALAELRRRGRRPPFLLVMSTRSRWAPRLARRLGVADRVHFAGWRDDVDRYLRAADTFVLPTAYETYCQSAHEAAATGLPVVAPPASGIAELLGDDEAGIRVRREAPAIAEALTRLEEEPKLRARLGEEGRRRVEQETLGRFAGETVGLYERLLGEGTEARSSSPGRS